MCRQSVNILALLIVAGTASGCGSGEEWSTERPKPVPVSGKVLLKGQPIDGATVTFYPQEHSHAATGQTNASGEFRVLSYGSHPGAVPGKYKVTVSKVEVVSSATSDETDVMHAKAPESKSLIPNKYGNPETSGLTADVKEGSENVFTFELTD